MMTVFDERSRARRAYTREDARMFPNDLPPKFLHDFLAEWAQIEEQLKQLQDVKKALLAQVRNRYGKHQAEALKITMKLALAMDDRCRVECLIHNDMARRYLEALGYVLPNEPTIDATAYQEAA
jgi:hypothetical protein